MDNRIASLISKKLTGDISAEETRELNGYLSTNHDLYETISLLEIAWQQDPFYTPEVEGVTHLLRKLRLPVSEAATEGVPVAEAAPEAEPAAAPARRLPLKSWMRIAASVAILLSSWAVYQYFNTRSNTLAQAEKVELNQITTSPGNRTRVVLRDGTQVWLNADSKLTYANDFDGDTREVKLSGEAFFDVVSNPAQPFIIHTHRTTVKVTGTSFNVRDYPGEKKSETSLITGKVEVRPLNDPDKVYHLRPNEKITLESDVQLAGMEKAMFTEKDTRLGTVPGFAKISIAKLQIDPVDSIPVETAWVNDQLAFNDESFREIADKMEKWFNVTIKFSTPALETLRFSGKFENESLDDALQALQFTTPFRFSRQGQQVFIHEQFKQ